MKNKLAIIVSTTIFLLLLIPINTNAQEKKLVTCHYEINTNEGIENIEYDIYDDEVKSSFKDGTILGNDSKLWYNGADFKNTFLESSKVSEKEYVCPTITVENSDSFYTVFNNPKTSEECNGVCTTYQANIKNKSEKLKVSTIMDTKKIGSVGIYKSKAYVTPYFRINENGTKQYSLDGKKYININESFKINQNNNTIRLNLDDKLIEKIYENNDINENISIYRCVQQENKNTYIYHLSVDETTCPTNDLSKKDGQELKSLTVGGALGDDDDDEDELTIEEYQEMVNGNESGETGNCSGKGSLLGDPNDEDSVAWLLQQLLNYIKILGPMIVIVMSSIDFAKGIVQSDEETMQKAQKKLILRLVLAAALFFVPTLVTVLLQIFGITTDPLCGLQ